MKFDFGFSSEGIAVNRSISGCADICSSHVTTHIWLTKKSWQTTLSRVCCVAWCCDGWILVYVTMTATASINTQHEAQLTDDCRYVFCVRKTLIFSFIRRWWKYSLFIVCVCVAVDFVGTIITTPDILCTTAKRKIESKQQRLLHCVWARLLLISNS